MKKKLNWDCNYYQKDKEEVKNVDFSFIAQYKERKHPEIIQKGTDRARLEVINFLLINNLKYLDGTFAFEENIDFVSRGVTYYFSIFTLKRQKGEIYNIDNFCKEFEDKVKIDLNKYLCKSATKERKTFKH